ncbi:MAG: zinc-binding dehydrogenase [Chloroflexi bacterium]|nr:zinc-binding dehydrogenase [Chloroflexota bacterium]
MGQVLTIQEPFKVGFDEYEDRPLSESEVRIQTLYSGISAGTELTAYRGSNPYLHKFWNEKDRLFVTSQPPSKQYPMIAFGYEECGRVIEIGNQVTQLKPGDCVYGNWGHRTYHIATEEWAAARLMPENLDPMLGIFNVITAIAYNGILDAAIRLGETVAVFGLGTPGQMVAQMAKRSGARVIGVDMIDLRLDLAQKMGWIDVALDARRGRIAERIKELTDNRGADVVIEVSGSYAALHEAIRAAAYSAKAITLGFFQAQGCDLYLGEEFHHNRINIVCSQIGGVSPELTYRWNRRRLEQMGIRLQAEGVLNFKPLITHVVPFCNAAEAYRIADQEPDKAIQVVLDFNN